MMASLFKKGEGGDAAPLLAVALLAVGVLTALRVALVFAGHYELYGDEAQYWTYAAEPAFGYYSKPPLLPWLIGLSTWGLGPVLGPVLGPAWGEGAVRLAAPLCHGATALLVFALARRLYDARTALWSAGLYASLPGVAFGALFASTDAPLLVAWTAALLALARLPDSRGPGWMFVLGAAFGLGLLAKYAMAYLLLGLAVHAVVAPAGRARLRDRRVWGGLGLGLLIWAPNLAWNLANGGATLLHIGENANLGADPWQVGAGLAFLGAQVGVAGPLVAGALVVRLALLPWRPAAARERFLLAFAVPVLAVIAVQAFRAGANANWAAVAYPGATILAVAWMRAVWQGVRARRALLARRVLLASLGLHGAVQAALVALVLLPPAARPEALHPLYAEVSGWPGFAAAVARAAEAAEATTVLVDHRYPFAQLWFYGQFEKGGKLAPPHLKMSLWRDVSNHYELRYPYRHAHPDGESGAPARVLYVTDRKTPDVVAERFARTVSRTVFTVDPPGAPARRYHALVLVPDTGG